ncbi:4-hydroxy-tetrahydrodipicolinate reductase [Pseudalkalibacillus berkeleyi]|uniref:4-hydroxy-tetrahydrodipicolinate reductase n=1 Tax=Pseudalkalibacillus berkeleyi TaxID=1069813 RepID=A0ABS9H1B4_9BACL|nr:4-hydroxy-tetrahydrodipicolinate reductase [Pseudalkalibacillus berkeleyi]MCF6137558.1 4-hydroxy-tetrahydrodipicolinate reductase [Pseudalkalibacillus berkeleyi]
MSEQTIRIIIAGPRGKMGKEAIKMVTSTEHFSLQAVVDTKNAGKKLSDLEDQPNLDIPVYDDMVACVSEVEADVLIDLTKPDSGKKHLQIALEYGLRPVIGTTGFTDQEIADYSRTAEEKEIGAVIAPNFAIGAILMMKFSQMAAKYMPDIEIIEQHHDQKLDAPSGTAMKTAHMIKEVRSNKRQGHPDETEDLQGARGGEYDGIRIHSVRLPGRVAHQEVLLGTTGQTLSIKHDTIDRSAFMPGVKMAVETVMKLDTLVYGLENLME